MSNYLNEYELNRKKFQQPFCDFLEQCGFDSYGYTDNVKLENWLQTEYDVEYHCKDSKVNAQKILQEGKFVTITKDGDIYLYKNNLYQIFEDIEDKYWYDFDEYCEQDFIYMERLYDWLKFKGYKSVEDIPKGNIIPDEITVLKPMEPDKNNYKKILKVYLVESKKVHSHYFDNDVFLVRPYYWGDGEKIIEEPNFIYYPKNIIITWYKYPLRGATINRKISASEFMDMLEDCKKSLG